MANEQTPSIVDQGTAIFSDIFSGAVDAFKSYQNWELGMAEQETKQALANQANMSGTINPTLAGANAQTTMNNGTGIPVWAWVVGASVLGVGAILALK